MDRLASATSLPVILRSRGPVCTQVSEL